LGTGLGAAPGSGMRTLQKIAAEIKVLVGARRNRADLLRFLIRRPAILGAVAAYETGLVVSSRADTRLKLLAQVKASSLIGCPF
jgi:hypothetical protein